MTLIPTNGVHITETQYPRGYQVASYDADGHCSNPRWFATSDEARNFAIAAQTFQVITQQLGR